MPSKFYTSDKPALSFELFPPRTPAGNRAMFSHLDKLMAFRPAFVTCTYGAGGSTRDRTLEIVCEVKKQYEIPVASHLTVVDASKDQLRQYLARARDNQIDFIVALRGDPPSGHAVFQPAADGLHYANELVELIRAEFPEFGIAVAGYPETHQEAPNADVDLENLKRKVDAGGDIVITQLFYDNADFFDFRDRAENAGINVPIIPGLLPVLSLKQVRKITQLCGARLPADFATRLSEKPDDADWQQQVGIEQATRQVEELVKRGVAGLHFYVLNKSASTIAILSSLENLSLNI
ncbi:MAG: methylenetetrahydrofolate reductase [NAD(P)H] [Pirellulaceae bacterium]